MKKITPLIVIAFAITTISCSKHESPKTEGGGSSTGAITKQTLPKVPKNLSLKEGTAWKIDFLNKRQGLMSGNSPLSLAVLMYVIPRESLADSMMGAQPNIDYDPDWTYWPVLDGHDPRRWVIGDQEHDLTTNPLFAAEVANFEPVDWIEPE